MFQIKLVTELSLFCVPVFSFSGGESACCQSVAAIIDKTTPKLYALTSLRIAVLLLVSVSVQDKHKL